MNNFRWTEAIAYCKKGLRACSSEDIATRLSLYGRLIEAQVKSKCYEDDMETFKKLNGSKEKNLNKFNLNSINAQDVDVKTPISDARKLINRIKAEPIRSEYFLENMNALEFEEDKKAIKILLALATFANGKVRFFKPLQGRRSLDGRGGNKCPPQYLPN